MTSAVIKGHFFLRYIFLTPNLLKTFQEGQYYEDSNFSLNQLIMTSMVGLGHIIPLLCQNHSSTFVYEQKNA